MNKKSQNSLGYDRWSRVYDQTLNSTVAADELNFPKFWGDFSGVEILEVGCGTGRHTHTSFRK
ncbi:MAG: hypothetical protein KA715_02775 [Xanthomonadaceae bacterium]|nr:hypothetical protein [Xanthomonadaceae bacterium]